MAEVGVFGLNLGEMQALSFLGYTEKTRKIAIYSLFQSSHNARRFMDRAAAHLEGSKFIAKQFGGVDISHQKSQWAVALKTHKQGVRNVRNCSLIAAFIFGIFASDAMAQAPASSGMTVAVVDVGYILKNHPTLKDQMDSVEKQMQAADEEMKTKRDNIIKQMEQLKERFTEGTAEYIAEEKRIAEQDTSFRLEIVRKRKEFDKTRANILYKVYQDIKGLVTYASDKMGIQVVLRVDATRATKEELDPNNPDTVQLLMGQQVIHFGSKVDLTQWILDGLKQRTAQAAGTPRG